MPQIYLKMVLPMLQASTVAPLMSQSSLSKSWRCVAAEAGILLLGGGVRVVGALRDRGLHEVHLTRTVAEGLQTPWFHVPSFHAEMSRDAVCFWRWLISLLKTVPTDDLDELSGSTCTANLIIPKHPASP